MPTTPARTIQNAQIQPDNSVFRTHSRSQNPESIGLSPETISKPRPRPRTTIGSANKWLCSTSRQNGIRRFDRRQDCHTTNQITPHTGRGPTMARNSQNPIFVSPARPTWNHGQYFLSNPRICHSGAKTSPADVAIGVSGGGPTTITGGSS
jgi:hypothetical protein